MKERKPSGSGWWFGGLLWLFLGLVAGTDGSVHRPTSTYVSRSDGGKAHWFVVRAMFDGTEEVTAKTGFAVWCFCLTSMPFYRKSSHLVLHLVI